MNPRTGSEAYDFDLFEERKPTLEEVPVAKKKAVKRSSRIQGRLRVGAVLSVSAVFILIISAILYTRVQINEVSNQAAAQAEQLKAVQSETVQLTNDLASKTSAKEVDDYAAAQGMHKVDSGQIRYISIGSGDSVQVLQDKKTGLLEQLASALTDFFNGLFS